MQYMHEYQTFHVMNLHMMNYPYYHRVNFVPYREILDNNHQRVYLLEKNKTDNFIEILINELTTI